MKTRADAKQEEFIETNGKLYINIDQIEVEEKDEDGNITSFWEMETLEVQDKRTAYNDVIAYYELQQARPLRELALDSENEFAKNKIAMLDEKIAKYR